MAEKVRPRRLLYRSARSFRSAGAFGLTMFSTMIGFGCVFLIVVGLMLPWPGWVKYFAWPMLLAVLFVPLAVPLPGGRSVWEVVWGWWNRRKHRRRRTPLMRSGPFTTIPDGTPPPGPLATASTFDFHPADGSAPFGLVALGSRNFYTLRLRAWPQGREWNVQSTRDRWVARLGDMMTFLGQSPEFVAMTITIETLPESGKRASTLVRRRLQKLTPALARTIVTEAVEQVASAEVRIEAYIGLTWRADTAFRKRDATEMGHDIALRIGKIRDYFQSAGLPVRPMREREICALTRRSFSPGDELDIETGLYSGEPMRLRWADCGPSSASDQHKQYIHDAAQSMSWTMKTTPEATFDSNVLIDILSAHRDIPRKRVTLVYQPYTPSKATRIVNKDHNDARQAVRTHVGKLSERSLVRVDNAEAARAEQARGAGVSKVSMIVTATCPVEADSQKIESIVTDLGLSASIPLEPAHSEQLVTYCAGLGLGVVLAEETTVSDKLAA
jgi:hypothetical protein